MRILLILEKKRIILNQFIKELERKAKHLLQAHILTIQEGPYVTIMADPDLLEQIFFNLLSNAVRYSSPESVITISWKLIPDYVEIQVADQGKGMDDETLSHAFEPFFRGKNLTSYSEKGSGLGLTLTKSMITAHGGTIWIESTPGKGTKVFFTLPL